MPIEWQEQTLAAPAPANVRPLARKNYIRDNINKVSSQKPPVRKASKQNVAKDHNEIYAIKKVKVLACFKVFFFSINHCYITVGVPLVACVHGFCSIPF